MLKGLKKWLNNLFQKRDKPVEKAPRSQEQIENDLIRKKYRLEELGNAYFVQYYFNETWWYLRIIDEDYTLQRNRGMAVLLQRPEFLEDIITRHQNWIKGGRFFMPFD